MGENSLVDLNEEVDDKFECPDAGGDIYPRQGHCNQYYLCRNGVPAKLYVFVSIPRKKKKTAIR